MLGIGDVSIVMGHRGNLGMLPQSWSNGTDLSAERSYAICEVWSLVVNFVVFFVLWFSDVWVLEQFYPELD